MDARRRSLVASAALLVVAICVTGCSAGGTAFAPDASPSTSGPTTSAGTTPGQLSLLVEPDQGMAPIYALIASARKSIDLTMYELVDTDADLALELAAGRGVNVRVLLDVNREKAANRAAYAELTDMRVHVAWA
ncbi:MAG TPA: phospholipase D-like domain-containing protein, partial [Acidothermaceae bacterium]|nr:phospholipase D-like domain-containing protein [Acidothermaceae bacterium]